MPTDAAPASPRPPPRERKGSGRGGEDGGRGRGRQRRHGRRGAAGGGSATSGGGGRGGGRSGGRRPRRNRRDGHGAWQPIDRAVHRAVFPTEGFPPSDEGRGGGRRKGNRKGWRQRQQPRKTGSDHHGFCGDGRANEDRDAHHICLSSGLHRVPLHLPKSSSDAEAESATVPVSASSLLESYPTMDESEAVSAELDRYSDEIRALERDRVALEQALRSRLSTSNDDDNDRDGGGSSVERRKGGYVVCVNDDGGRDALAALLGTLNARDAGDRGYVRGGGRGRGGRGGRGRHRNHNRRNHRRGRGDSTVLILREARRRPRQSSVRSIALSGVSGGFFIVHDDGSAVLRGSIPLHLEERLQRERRPVPNAGDGGEIEGGANGTVDASPLRCLAAGPRGSYYAELTDGECWWGISTEDDDDGGGEVGGNVGGSDEGKDNFHSVVAETDVLQVSFGEPPPPSSVTPPNVEDNADGTSESSPATPLPWIVLGRDGSAAWHAVHPTLHDLLLSRRTDGRAAPCGVSLGRNGAYYVRFLDGTYVVWGLPDAAGKARRNIEKKGGTVTDVAFGLDGDDCVLRYTDR